MTGKELGDLLKRIRLQAGHDQAAMADKLSVNPIVVSRFEDGDREPSLEVLRAWGAACGQSVEVAFVLSSETQGDSAVLADLIQAYHKLSPPDRALVRDFGLCLGTVTPRWRDVVSSQIDALLGRTQQVQMPIFLPVQGRESGFSFPMEDEDIAHRLRTRTGPPPRAREEEETEDEGWFAPLAEFWTEAVGFWGRLRVAWRWVMRGKRR